MHFSNFNIVHSGVVFLCLYVGEETNWGHLAFSRCSSWILKTEALIYNYMKTLSQSFYIINT